MDVEFIERRIEKLEERITFLERFIMELPIRLKRGVE